ncbi:MAG: hypothetical protein ACRC78_22340 [Planktothrix sp.]
MNCPKCHSKTKVEESRTSIRNDLKSLGVLDISTRIRRRRICLNCHFKFTSYELLREDYEDLIRIITERTGS